MAGRRNVKGKPRKPQTYTRVRTDYNHKKRVVDYLQAGHTMAETVANFFGHLPEHKQKNKKRDIRKWRDAIDEINRLVAKGKGDYKNKRERGTATILPATIEEQIVFWINGLRRDGVPVSRLMLQLYALDCARDNGIDKENFVASKNWRGSFLRRHKLAVRCKTRAGQR